MWLSRRGGGLRAHARAGHGSCSTHDRAGARRRARDGRRPRRSSACTTRSASRIEMTSELLAEEGLAIDGRLRGADGASSARAAAPARARARRARRRGGDAARARPSALRRLETERRTTRFTRLRDERAARPSAAPASRRRATARYLVKLAESPFYAAGGGQVADVGTIECERRRLPRARRGRLPARRRPGARRSSSSEGELHAGRAGARARRPRARATRPRPTTPRRTCCTRRCASASAATCARPAPTSGPDKLRFDFSHGAARSASEELRDVEDRVNEWIARNDPVRADHDDARRGQAARRDGAVRREVRRRRADGRDRRRRVLARAVRRHARALDRRDRRRSGSLSETSSAANVRRIEALTGPGGGRAAARARPRCSARSRGALRTRPSDAAERSRARERERSELEKALKRGARAARAARVDVDALAGARRRDRRRDACSARDGRGRRRQGAARRGRPRSRASSRDAAIVLGAAVDGRVHLRRRASRPSWCSAA